MLHMCALEGELPKYFFFLLFIQILSDIVSVLGLSSMCYRRAELGLEFFPETRLKGTVSLPVELLQSPCIVFPDMSHSTPVTTGKPQLILNSSSNHVDIDPLGFRIGIS